MVVRVFDESAVLIETLGVKTAKLEIAATVTRGAVRCSAWLGVAVIGLRRVLAISLHLIPPSRDYQTR